MQKLLQLLLPRTCLLCGLPSKQDIDLCAVCQCNLPWKSAPWQQPLPLANCTFALFDYQPPIDKLIIGLKFNNKLLHAKILGELMANHLAKYYQQAKLPEAIIPVPLHNKRLRKRGYNQAVELARPIAKKLNLPINLTLCHRAKATQAQALIPAKERAPNVSGAFRIKKYSAFNHIALIDDVITTGNTISELCRTLHAANITKIDIWCCARPL